MSDDGFEYESETDSNVNHLMDAGRMENLYYEAEDCRVYEPEKSMSIFEQIMKETTSNDEEVIWRFKALIQIILISFRLNLPQTTSSSLEELFRLLDRVSRNEGYDGLNEVINDVNSRQNLSFESREDIYVRVLAGLEALGPSNYRLWFGTALHLARLYMEDDMEQSVVKLSELLVNMRATCQTSDGHDDVASKGSQLLEVYAIEVQMLSRRWNRHSQISLKKVLSGCEHVVQVVGNPRASAVIREALGKVRICESRAVEAYIELFEAFRIYADSGNARAAMALKYAVLANVLSLSNIDPFDSREARAYLDDPGVAVMYELRRAYDERNLEQISAIFVHPNFDNDAFIQSQFEAVLYQIRTQIVRETCKVYSSIRLEKLRERLKSDLNNTIRLVMKLIADGTIAARMSQGLLVIKEEEALEVQENYVIRDYAMFVKEQLTSVHDTLRDMPVK